MRRRRELSAEELALWRRAMGEGVRREPPSTAPPADSTTEQPGAALARRSLGAGTLVRRTRALDPERPIDLDRRTWLRLKRGQIAIEDVLDLHGQTQEQAHERLVGFLARAQSRRSRCVLVVTGKGLESGGVLRHMVPRWLNEAGNRERVLAYCAAQRQHGGDGALYVLVRRPRAEAPALRLRAGGRMTR